MLRPPPRSTLFLTRRSSDLLLVLDAPALEIRRNRAGEVIGLDVVDGATIKLLIDDTGRRPRPPAPAYEQIDRKSTRLNSSHEWISYAVFCLKKKKRRPHGARRSGRRPTVHARQRTAYPAARVDGRPRRTHAALRRAGAHAARARRPQPRTQV